jgi:hypothetical protein
VAKFQFPSYRQRTSFTTWIGNLGESVKQDSLKSFVERLAKCRVSSVALGDLSFTDKTGPGVVQALLRRHGGPLTSFEMAPVHSGGDNLKRKALCRFANASAAERACEYYRRYDKIQELGGSKLFLQRLFTVKYTLPITVFDSIKAEVEAKLKELPALRYNMFENLTTRTISIQADGPDVVASIKSKLEPLVAGDVVRDPALGNRVLWNRYVSSTLFHERLGNLTPPDGGCIWRDKRRQEVRVFGSEDKRSMLKERVLKDCVDAMVETNAVPISRYEFEYILWNGRSAIDKMTMATSARKVSIDIKNQSLLVEGSASQARRAKAYIAKLASGYDEVKDQERNDILCPVCFYPPGDDDASCDSVINLSCDHGYCRECFDAWLGGGNIREFPLVCLSDGCSAPVSLHDLNQNLDSATFLDLLRFSLDDHVRKNPSELQFCVSPTCPGIYEIAKDSLQASCSSCSLVICVKCKVSHGGLSCKDYRLASQPPDLLRMRIVDEILTLRCPRCSQAFLDFDGCFSLACSVCPCRFCGWCLKDCGSDAHPHVKVCPLKAGGADTYFGTKEQFEAAQNKRRHEGVLEFLGNLSPRERSNTLESIRKDLKDLGLHL